jgi:hypothetical protein
MKAESSFIGIDYHKRYSVFCVLDAQGEVLERGRIDHLYPEQFIALVGRWPRCRVVFEACMNWHWLLEILEEAMPRDWRRAKGSVMIYCGYALVNLKRGQS